MKIFAITHAEKEAGSNPGLTENGLKDILTRAKELPRDELKNMVVGTGKRFCEVSFAVRQRLTTLSGHNSIESVKYSPLLGSADSGKKTETGFEAILADGTNVPIGDYIGLIGTPGIDLWAWLKSLSEGTLLCTGREFIGALGVKNAEAGQIYVIDTDLKSVSIRTVLAEIQS